ncbi:MAG: hypothetical protein IPF72_08800 [Chitinophagaceae bacterium]|nr:hypothetical protein [Chitinophagaceae bacterium]
MKYATTSLAILLFFSSCSDNSKSTSSSLHVFRAMEGGLQQSIKTTSRSSEILYRSLEDRLTVPASSSIAMVWQPKALAVRSYSDSVIKYIRQLKEELKDETGFSNPIDRGSFKEDNIPTVNHYFKEHKKGEELFNRLIEYKRNVLAVDSQLNYEFKNNIGVFAAGFDEKKDGPKEFTKIFFGEIPVIAAMAMLSKFENNVKIIENEFIMFCHSKSHHFMIIDDFPQPLISQSKSYVKGGEQIEITAGIGSYSAVVQPKFFINGNVISPDDQPIAVYKLKAINKPGKYYVPVKIEFTKADGAKETMEKNIEYTVIKEK